MSPYIEGGPFKKDFDGGFDKALGRPKETTKNLVVKSEELEDDADEAKPAKSPVKK